MRDAADRPSRWFLGAMGACAAFGVVLVLSDPAAQQTSSQVRWTVPPAQAAVAAPVVDAALAAREAQEARFAAIDEALGAAAAGARLAALEAHDVGLRAFAAQQAARYDELRVAMRTLAGQPAITGQPVIATTAGDVDDELGALHAERLRALREADGAGFDLQYVRHALALNRALLAELDAALATIEDVELRDAVERVRGTIDATMPASDAGARESADRDSRG